MHPQSSKQTISIVIPVFNEQETIPAFYQRLKHTLQTDFAHCKHEIIYVDDGSSDCSFTMLQALAAQDDAVHVISFSRNFGHHLAVTAGLDHATGDYVVMMDGDLQDQPEEIKKLYNKLHEGYDVVAGQRINKKFSLARRLTAQAFVAIIRALTDKRIIINNTIFRIITKQVAIEVKKLRETHRYLVGVIGWVGFKHTYAPVEHGKRYAGTSKYTLSKQLKLAFDAIVSFSDRFLRLISCLGFFLVFISALLICTIMFRKIAYGIPVLGWASLVSTILCVGGLQITILGVLGEYLGRTYMETKKRPLYVVRTYVNKKKGDSFMNTAPETQAIKQFWDQQAQKHGLSSLATMPDSIGFNMELAQLTARIPADAKVLDLGCGNGVKGVWLTQRTPFHYVGIDYAAEMIAQAHTLVAQEAPTLKGTVHFAVGDMLDQNMVQDTDFDLVMSVRSLINLGTFQNQVLAVKHAHTKLKDGGTYLMIENSKQALNNLNNVRKDFGLEPIQERWHNLFLDEEQFFSTIAPYFTRVETVNFESTYFLISRTINAALTPPGQEVDFNSQLNALAAKLPPLGDYSPRKLFVLKKVATPA